MKVLLGCEESQAVCITFREQGHEAYSCDLQECSGGHPEWHLQMDIFKAICGGELITEAFTKVNIDRWNMAVFFPDCTFLTCSAEWAYKDGPYHQKIKPGTLVGKARVNARAKAFEFFMALWNCGIENLGIENPVGIMSRYFRKPDQIIHPYEFGNDASKATCLWLRGLNKLTPTSYILPRFIDGKKRWGNQTDSGQNNLTPTPDRAKLRSKTYPGIAKAMAEQWGGPVLC